jgi:hypothetical protein
VNVGSTTWRLRRPCPCCGQGGACFSTCLQCSRVVLVCAEVGTVFPDPHDLTTRGDACACGATEFGEASSDAVGTLGFTPDDYE